MQTKATLSIVFKSKEDILVPTAVEDISDLYDHIQHVI